MDKVERKGSVSRVLSDMASLGLGDELRRTRRYRVVGSVGQPSAKTQHANNAEVKAAMGKKGKARKAKPKKLTPTEQALAAHTRDRPTKERIAQGVFEHVDLARFDTQRAGDKVLLDHKARSGGAGEMYLRGQLKRREADAAAMLLELLETSQASGLSCGEVKERVDGGKLDLDGQRLQHARIAWGQYQEAMGKLSAWGRFVVEQRVLGNVPLDVVVSQPQLAAAVGEGGVKPRAKRGLMLLRDALNHLADHFHLPQS